MTLLEVTTFLVVSALVVGTSMAVYAGASETGSTDESLRELNSIRDTVASFMASQGTYTGLNTSLLAQNKSLPSRWSDGSALINPYRGQVSVNQVSDYSYSVTYKGVPVASCIKLLTTEYGNQLTSLSTQNGVQPVFNGRALTPSQALAACNPRSGGSNGTAQITWVFGDPLASGAGVDPATIVASLPPVTPSSTPLASTGTPSMGGSTDPTSIAIGPVGMPSGAHPGGTLPASYTATTPAPTPAPAPGPSPAPTPTPTPTPTPAPAPTPSPTPAPAPTPAPSPAPTPANPQVAITPSALGAPGAAGDFAETQLLGASHQEVDLHPDNTISLEGGGVMGLLSSMPPGYGTDWSLYVTWEGAGALSSTQQVGSHNTFYSYALDAASYQLYYVPGPSPSFGMDTASHSVALIDNPPGGAVLLANGSNMDPSKEFFSINYQDLSSFGMGVGWGLTTNWNQGTLGMTAAGSQFFAATNFDPNLINLQLAITNTPRGRTRSPPMATGDGGSTTMAPSRRAGSRRPLSVRDRPVTLRDRLRAWAQSARASGGDLIVPG